jgi:predicted small lipoprotein YifL
MIVLGLAVLALGGCGRKGPLDLPPAASSQSSASSQSAAAPPPAGATQADADAERAANKSAGLFDNAADPPLATPKGTKKSFVLDPLLNN